MPFLAAFVFGLIVVVATAVLWAQFQDRRAEDAVAEERRDCITRAHAGAEIKATAMEGVKHAEQTAAVLDSVIASLEAATGPEPWPPLVQIRADVDKYAAGVADYRAVAERYTPITVDQCEADG